MVTIQIRDLVAGANNSDQGKALLPHLRSAMASGAPFVVSFANIQTATSSFVNSAFVPLLKDFSFGDIKVRMRVTNRNSPDKSDDQDAAGARCARRRIGSRAPLSWRGPRNHWACQP